MQAVPIMFNFCFCPLQNVDRKMTISAKNGVEYYLVDVIAQILKYLKNELIENLPQNQGRGRRLEATDFDWVITVPAIWRSRGKQMMREAGYKVQYKCIKIRFSIDDWFFCSWSSRQL